MECSLALRATLRTGRQDLEGGVAKLASGRYHADGTSTSWFKIKNPAYTQMTVRHRLFDRSGSHKRRPMLRVT